MKEPILPGATLGVFGSGQLGRMFAIAASRMGYHVHCYSPESNSPCGEVCQKEWVAPYDDLPAVEAFAKSVHAITVEFENVPSQALSIAAGHTLVRPSASVLSVCQNRIREKGFLSMSGFPVPDFEVARSVTDLQRAANRLGFPLVLKSSGFGYDGKGQRIVRNSAELEPKWNDLGAGEAIVEQFVDFAKEVSIIGARGVDGTIALSPLFENAHLNHILDFTLAPARVPPELETSARELCARLLEVLEVVGLLCVELFVTSTGKLLINELAPRPHNSGHLTIEACRTSQFEQQVRTLSGLPLGDFSLRQPAAMANLLGHLWENGEPDWKSVLSEPGLSLHLYGKREARAGRKMGHMTLLGDAPGDLAAKLQSLREGLTRKS